MAGGRARARHLAPVALMFTGALLLRLATARTALIDDDEAWFSVSGYSTPSPSFAMRAVIDNKPPGTTWFYWLVAHLFGAAHLPQKARLIQGILLLATSGLIAAIGCKLSRRARARPLAVALLFFLALGAAGPKLFSVTNEGLMLPCVSLAFLLIWPSEASRRSRGAAFVSGMALAAAILIKQTGILFMLPWFLALAASAGAAAPAVTGLLGGLAAGIAAAGPALFWHCAFAYPFFTLRSARAGLFSEPGELLPNLIFFSVALLPLLASVPQALAHGWRARGSTEARVLLAWAAAALASVAAGEGLFMHYFLLLAPPLCLLFVYDPQAAPMSRRGWLWLGTFYAASAAVAACGAFGVFWGNDLPYYERVGARIRAITSSDARVFIWGGSAAPLALSGRHGIPGFPTARFTAPPYSTPELESLFLARFDSNEPDLVVDLHLRGDNRFRRPLEALPPLARAIDRDYTRWADPALPWAYFYLRKRPGSSPGTARSALCRARPIGVTGLDAGFSVTSVIRAGWEHRWSWPTLDRDLRARYALAWAGAACAQAPSQLNEAGQEMTPLDLSALFESSGYAAPFSVTDPLWWASLAVVELQPRGEIKPR